MNWCKRGELILLLPLAVYLLHVVRQVLQSYAGLAILPVGIPVTITPAKPVMSIHVPAGQIAPVVLPVNYIIELVLWGSRGFSPAPFSVLIKYS